MAASRADNRARRRRRRREVKEESKRVAFLGRGHSGSRSQTKASPSRRPEITAAALPCAQGKFAPAIVYIEIRSCRNARKWLLARKYLECHTSPSNWLPDLKEGGRGGGVESSIFHSLSKLTFAHARVRVYIYIYIYTLLFVGYTRRLNDCKTL